MIATGYMVVIFHQDNTVHRDQDGAEGLIPNLQCSLGKFYTAAQIFHIDLSDHG
ncbi:hypothetical protein D3C76_1650590 [compost metagenome]